MMLSREELENIKVGDKINFEASWVDRMLCGLSVITATVAQTRVRCGEQGDVFDDYVITEDGEEIDYERIIEVIK